MFTVEYSLAQEQKKQREEKENKGDVCKLKTINAHDKYNLF